MKFCLMSKAVVSLIMTCAASLVLSPVRAQPAPVVVTFLGAMTDLSCTPILAFNPGYLVELDPISESDIPNVGDTAGDTYFTVAADCGYDNFTSDKPSKVKAYFYADNIGEGRLNLTGGTGSGWQYQLLSAKGGMYQLDVLADWNPSDNALDPGNDMIHDTRPVAYIEYIVRYYRSKENLTPGTGTSSVNVVLFWP